MVKKLISITIILLFAIEIVFYDWPTDIAQMAHNIALVILAIATGITIGGHIGGGKHGKTKD